MREVYFRLYKRKLVISLLMTEGYNYVICSGYCCYYNIYDNYLLFFFA